MLSRRRLLRRLSLLSAAVAAVPAAQLARAASSFCAPWSALRDELLQVEWVSRSAWGAAPAASGMRPQVVERVTVHHTGPPAWYGNPPAAAYLRAIQAFHQGPERGWPDIAYHLLIDLDGVVWEGRSLEFAGDSATSYDPWGHALVAVLGDYDQQSPNQAQVDALAATIRGLLTTYNLSPDVVAGHRDYAATACPGMWLYALLPRLK